MSNGMEWQAKRSAHPPQNGIAVTVAELKKSLHDVVMQRPIQEATRSVALQEIAETVLRKSKVMRDANFQVTTGGDLQRMAELYDEKFFDGKCLTLARHFGVDFRWSKRMTSNGGKTVRYQQRDPISRTVSPHYEIVLSATLLFQTFGDIDRPFVSQDCSARIACKPCSVFSSMR